MFCTDYKCHRTTVIAFTKYSQNGLPSDLLCLWLWTPTILLKVQVNVHVSIINYLIYKKFWTYWQYYDSILIRMYHTEASWGESLDNSSCSLLCSVVHHEIEISTLVIHFLQPLLKMLLVSKMKSSPPANV